MLNKTALANKTLLHLAIIVLLGFLVYSNTFEVPFLFDDISNIVDNPIIRDFSLIFDESSKTAEVRTGYSQWLMNRIVGYLTFAFNYRAHGLDVKGYHVVNLAIHIANALLVYWLILLTFMTPLGQESYIRNHARIVALFSGVLFVSHPINTQAVTYIVQRFASLATLFYLLSLALYIKCRLSQALATKSLFIYVLALMSAMLAMKTKEIAFTLPVVILLYEFMFFRFSLRKRLPYLIPFLLTMLIIPISLLSASMDLGDVIGEFRESTRLATTMPRSDYLLTQLRVITTYIRLLFLPINQVLDYDYPVYGLFFVPSVLLPTLFLISLIVLGIYLLHYSRTSEPVLRQVSFGIFWFFITLSVESSIIPIKDIIFEHRLYLPNVGIIMAVATATAIILGGIGGKRIRVAATASVVVLSLVLATATYFRNSVWQNKISMWEDVAEKSPNWWRGHYNLAIEYAAVGRNDNALVQYQISIRLAPNVPAPHLNMANVYVKKGLYDKAIEEYQVVIRLMPDDVVAYYNIGTAYYYKRQYDKAIEYYKTAVRLKPDHADAHNDLGATYFKLGLNELARKEFEEALRINPNLLEARRALLFLSASEDGASGER